ncbi:MAG: serine/threonine protein kinase, partial [Hyphomicrobiaceae bacterium]
MNVTALQPGSKVGGYEVKRLLGAGGFGMTYEGFNPITRNRVAIKELFPKGIVSRQGATIIIGDQRDRQVFQSVLKKFEDSTTKLAQLSHPNIVKVFDYIPGNNTGYMMMEYIEGDILAGRLEKFPSRALPSEAEFARVFQPILDALAYVHANNLIHRDISPDNIMIDRTGRPVLIDFGAFKEMDQTNRASTLMVAREAYAPPEQGVVDGIAHMPYTDVYALGATMYETLAGEPPARAAKRVFVKTDPYVPLAQKAKIPLSPALSAAIDRCLRLAAEERPQSI